MHFIRIMVPWQQSSGAARLTSLLRHPNVAAVEFRGAATADATACRALVAAVHAGTDTDLPLLVAVDAHARNALPGGLQPPDPRHLALDLAAGGEDFEVTLKVLNWARKLAEMGVDLVLSPRLDRTQPPLDDDALAARLAAAWTEALLAAGLVACAGPWRAPADPSVDDAWAPFGAALAHGLEAIFLDCPPETSEASEVETLRTLADDVVIVGSPVSDAAQVLAGVEAGVDLVRIAEGLTPDETDAILDATRSTDGDAKTNRVDALREDWLV